MCVSTTSADTWWSCSLWAQTRPFSKPSATSSRCRRSWRSSTDVTNNAPRRTKDRWPLDCTLLALMNQLIKSEMTWSAHLFLFSLMCFSFLMFWWRWDGRDKFYNLFNRFCYTSEHYPEYNLRERDIVGCLHCEQITVSDIYEMFWVTCVYKNMKSVWICRSVFIYWICTYWRLILDIFLWIHLVNLPD